MEAYKREFIQFLQSAGVLKFGDFTAKSGRKIPVRQQVMALCRKYPLYQE